MKAILPHPFYIYASKFSFQSIMRVISFWAFYLMKHPDKDMGMFGTTRKYQVVDNGQTIRSKVALYQTNLIDVSYAIVMHNQFGTREMNVEEALYLIQLHVGLEKESHVQKNGIDFWMYLFGMLGEQTRFQQSQQFFEDFSREKYILDTISQKQHPKNTFSISVCEEFFERIGLKTDDYSALLFVLYLLFAEIQPWINLRTFNGDLDNPALTDERIIEMVKRYSVTPDEVRDSSLGRQTFYLKPILEVDGIHICVNPFLMLCTFVNSNYWEMCNHYRDKKSDLFKIAFGKYFEIYVEELLAYCLDATQFENIEETDKEKRADWHLTIDDYHFLVEQKSAISLLGIKQSHPDIEAMKQHITRNWGKAVKQLAKTQKHLQLEDAIKIILVYEDYYNSSCLDYLFEMMPELVNDRSYWLVPIRDFEMLMHTYKTNSEVFKAIVSQKIEAEKTWSNEGRQLLRFFHENGVTHNYYLEEQGISGEFERIENMVTNKD